jgi:hypothetical protein
MGIPMEIWNTYPWMSLLRASGTDSDTLEVAHGAYPDCKLRVDAMENML